MSWTDDDDSSFVSLSARLRRRIDDAFNSTVQSHKSDIDVTGGGFIVEEPSRSSLNNEPGGFIAEAGPSDFFDALSWIPLSEIPRALNLLDLSPEDDIMAVFKNAAGGWGAQDVRNDGVSRKDWRAVCAVLLEGENDGKDGEEYTDEDIETGPDSDEYQLEPPSGDTGMEDSNDEYEEPDRIATRKATRKTPGTDVPRHLTDSEKAQCRQDFKRFFPHVPDDELEHQRIMIKDITRVAESLKENLKTEEMVEMLGAFSSSPDKSMTLADFERMMILTKLV